MACGSSELGERGRGMPGRVSEGVPPAMASRSMEPAPAPAPARARVPAPAPARARAPVPAPAPTPAPAPAPPSPAQDFTPSMQLYSAPATPQLRVDELSLVSVLLERDEKQQKLMLDREEKLRHEVTAEKAELRQEMQRQVEQLCEALTPVPPTPPEEVVTGAELAALQERIERLHATKLWKDEEMFAIEDTVSDFIEIKAQVGAVTQEIAQANPVAGAIKHLVALSGGMPNDAAFARQARRKFL